MNIFEIIILSFYGLAIAVCIYMLARNSFAYKAHVKVSNAIYAHNRRVIEQHQYDKIISYDDIEEYDDTMKRFWDWNYKHIVPPDIFELIKPFLED